MKNLIKEIEKQLNDRLKERIEDFKNDLESSGELTRVERYHLNRKTPYKRSRESQVIKRLQEIHNKELSEKLEKIAEIQDAPEKLESDLIITINFYKSNTWGWCPKGNDSNGNVTDSITGCGYCKESTATAQLLNQNKTILKRMYKLKNKNASGKSNDVVGYGAGYGVLPIFEGGVGVECHISILEKLGFKVTRSGNDNTTVIIIRE